MKLKPFRADGGDIGTGRIREIADNPYGDEEKCWLAQRVLALQAELKFEHEQNVIASRALITQHVRANEAEARIAETENDKSRMVDAMHAAVALNSAGINLNDFDECVLRLHEWGALPDYCIALYVDFIHGFVSENKLLDFGYINDNGAFSARQAEKRIAKLEAREVKLPPTFWYEHDDLPREIPVLSRRLVIKALRETGVKVAAAGKGECVR